MLYKKYHRNFVSQFKKETRYGYKAFSGEIYRDIIKREPYIIGSGNIHITGKKYGWTLVYPGGRINKDLLFAV